jgi:hypothetical protein
VFIGKMLLRIENFLETHDKLSLQGLNPYTQAGKF